MCLKTWHKSKETIEQIVKLDSDKIFEGVFVVRKDGSVVKLDSKVNEKGEVVFTDNGLGKYIISYKTEVVDIKDEDNLDEKKVKEEKTNYMPYIVGGIIALLAGCTVLYFIIGKRQ